MDGSGQKQTRVKRSEQLLQHDRHTQHPPHTEPCSGNERVPVMFCIPAAFSTHTRKLFVALRSTKPNILSYALHSLCQRGYRRAEQHHFSLVRCVLPISSILSIQRCRLSGPGAPTPGGGSGLGVGIDLGGVVASVGEGGQERAKLAEFPACGPDVRHAALLRGAEERARPRIDSGTRREMHGDLNGTNQWNTGHIYLQALR